MKEDTEEPQSSGSNFEYVPEQLDVKGSVLEAFSDVFARFQLPPEETSVRDSPIAPHHRLTSSM